MKNQIKNNFLDYIYQYPGGRKELARLLAKLVTMLNNGSIYDGCQLDHFQKGDILGIEKLMKIGNGKIKIPEKIESMTKEQIEKYDYRFR